MASCRGVNHPRFSSVIESASRRYLVSMADVVCPVRCITHASGRPFANARVTKVARVIGH